MSAPRVCLNMIVKDEAHVIRRCFASVLPFIDTWAIVDTGSTDGTQQVIRDFFAGARQPGVLEERPWKDFGTNRSEALALARGRAEYTLIIDADEVFEVPDGFTWPELRGDAYQLLHRSGQSETHFWLTKLVRSALPWRYVGVLHEALHCSEAHRVDRIEGPLIHGMFDSARNRLTQEEKYTRDALVLEAALKKEPDNARYVFYLGQSWRDARQYAKSLEAYRRRATMNGWEEEGWYAQFQVGRCLEHLDRRAEAIHAHLTTYQRRPTRAEPLCDLARMHRESGDFYPAYLFARAADEIARPDDTLFVDDAVYRWRSRDERSIAAYWTGRYVECADLTRRLLDDGKLPQGQRQRVQKNLRFALDKLG
jgi:glycosyltransferase involved in cell wall biosynthesis